MMSVLLTLPIVSSSAHFVKSGDKAEQPVERIQVNFSPLLLEQHLMNAALGGGEELSNKFVLHRHCHDQRHARRVNGTSDKSRLSEEPCDGKLSCTVLKPSGGGDSSA